MIVLQTNIYLYYNQLIFIFKKSKKNPLQFPEADLYFQLIKNHSAAVFCLPFAFAITSSATLFGAGA